MEWIPRAVALATLLYLTLALLNPKVTQAPRLPVEGWPTVYRRITPTIGFAVGGGVLAFLLMRDQ